MCEFCSFLLIYVLYFAVPLKMIQGCFRQEQKIVVNLCKVLSGKFPKAADPKQLEQETKSKQ